jgi:MFS family permease
LYLAKPERDDVIDLADENRSSGRRPGFVIAILFLLVVLSYLDRAVISLVVPQLHHDLGISDFQISLLQGAAFATFYSACGLPMCWLVDRFPRRAVIYLGVTAWSLATTSAGLAGTFLQLFCARLGVGAGEATLSPAAYSIIADVFSRRQLGRANSFYAMGTIVGNAAALFIGSAVIAWTTSLGRVVLPIVGGMAPWQLTFLVLGLPGFLLAPLIFLVREPPRSRAGTPTASTWRDFLRFLSGRKLYFCSYIGGFTTLAMLALAALSWMPAYLQRHYHLGIREVGSSLSLVSGVSGVLGYLFTGWAVDRWFAAGAKDAHFRFGLLAAATAGVCGVAAFLVQDLRICLVLVGAMLASTSITGVAVAHLQITTPGHFRGRVVALYLFVQSVFGVGLSPSLVAALTDFVFHDPRALGRSLAIVIGVLAPIACLLLAVGLKPALRAVQWAESVLQPSEDLKSLPDTI